MMDEKQNREEQPEPGTGRSTEDNAGGYTMWRGEPYHHGKPLLKPNDTSERYGPSIVIPAKKKDRSLMLLVFTVFIGLCATALESNAHIIGQWYGDPLPHAGYLTAYVVAVLAPIFVRIVTTRSDSPLLLGIAASANAFSMVMGAAMILALMPIAPFALIAILLLGIGLLGYSPHFLLLLTIFQRISLSGRLRELGLQPRQGALAAIATAVMTASVLFIQPLFVGEGIAQALRPDISPAAERKIADRLHRFGGDAAVLTLCYRTPLPLWERWGAQYLSGKDTDAFSLNAYERDDINPTVKQARRLYFLMTGHTYADAPVPWTVTNHRTEQWINDVATEEVGGTRVGRTVPGLSLENASGTATLDTRTATGECDWTMTFRNAGDTDNEARAEILLPPGAVLHQASLWIDGVERPAAFGPQATVRRAYQEVAVVQRRDPLLVTMPTPGKLFVQCFPVPASGQMKIRLGATFPLAPDSSDRRRMIYTPPAFGATNFACPVKLADCFHASDAATGLAPVLPLTLPEGTHWTERAGVRQPVSLLVALDTSAGMEPVFGAKEQAILRAAVRELPVGSRVRFTRADDTLASWDEVAPGGLQHDPDFEPWRRLRFEKGHDNVPGLTTNIRENLGKDEILLYLHGPIPETVSDPAPLSEAVKTLTPMADGRPRFISVLLAPNAPDALGDRLAMQGNTRVYSAAMTDGDFARLIDTALETAVRGDHLTETSADATPTAEIRRARLRAYQTALATWYQRSNFGEEALAAARTAAALRLVTPLSGAVVLATQEDYKKHGLDDGTKSKDSDAKDSAKATPKDPAQKVDAGVAPEQGTVVLMLGAGVVVLIAAGAGHFESVRRYNRGEMLSKTSLLRLFRSAGRPFMPAPVVMALLLVGCTNAAGNGAYVNPSPSPVNPPVRESPVAPAMSGPSRYRFNAKRSFADLQKQVDFGPRYPGSAGYPAMRDWLVKELTDASGVTAQRQDFTASPHGKPLAMSNIYATINPEAKKQILLCAHWDTRPTADQEIDKEAQKKPIPGANDGASGVAVLLELARVLKAKPPTNVGVQIVFFDGEDYGPGEEQMYLGAKQYAKALPLIKPIYAILIDMIGDKDLQIYREQESENIAPEIDDKVWHAAADLKIPAFQDTVKYSISDDHLPLQKIGIKAIDLIDFDYGPWHTLDDTPDKCAPESLQAVGDVLAKVVYDEK